MNRKVLLFGIAMFFLLLPMARADLTSNIFGAWLFNNQTPETESSLIDSSPRGLNLTVTNPFHHVNGIFIKAYNFSRASPTYIDLGQTFVDLSANSMTLAFWVKPSTIGIDQNLVTQGTGGGDGTFQIRINGASNNAYFAIRSGGDWQNVAGGLVNDPSLWYHYCNVYNATEGRIHFYLNGTDLGTAGISGLDALSLGGTAIGTKLNDPGSEADASYDAFHVYKRAFSQQECQDLMAAGEYPFSTAPNITQINFTSDAPPEEICNYPNNCANTSVQTPTFRLTTDINAHCRFSLTEQNFTQMSNECIESGLYNLTHVCVQPTTLPTGQNIFYFTCNASSGLNTGTPLANNFKANITVIFSPVTINQTFPPDNTQFNFTHDLYFWATANITLSQINVSLLIDGIVNTTQSATGGNNILTNFTGINFTIDDRGAHTWKIQYDTQGQTFNSSIRTFIIAIPNNMSITAVDSDNSSRINNFSANIQDNTGLHIFYSNATGFAILPYLDNETQLVNITFMSLLYQNRTYSNYNTSTNLTGNLTTVRGNLNITAIDLRTNASINNFSIIASDQNSSDLLNGNTNIGSVMISGIRGNTYNISIDATGYEFNTNASNTAYTFQNSSSNFTFFLNPGNVIDINVSDEVTNLLVTQNLSLIVSSGAYIQPYTFIGPSFRVENLSSQTYRLDFSNANYSVRSYFITLNRDVAFLHAYLLANGLPITFIARDSFENLISGATFTFYKPINGSYVAVAQKITDITGTITLLTLQNTTTYRIIINAQGFQTKQFDLEIDASSYTVHLQQNNTINFQNFQGDVTYSIFPEGSYITSADSTNFTLTTSSPSGFLANFGSDTTFANTFYSQNVTGSPSGGSAILNINTTGHEGESLTIKYFIQTQGGFLQQNITYIIYGLNQTLDNSSISSTLINYKSQIRPFYRYLIALSISLLMGAGFFVLLGAMGSSAVSVLTWSIFGFSGFVPWVFSLVTMILMVIGYIVLGGNEGT